jgi:hypothetical protein
VLLPVVLTLLPGTSCSQGVPQAAPAAQLTPAPTLAPTPNTTSPVITEIIVEQAVYDLLEVIWKTNEPTIGRLEYGLAPNIDLSSPWTTEMSTNNGIIETGLQPYGLYSFRIRVKDAAGNEAVSEERTVYLWAVAGEGTPRIY